MNAFLSALLTASLSGTAAALVLIAGKKRLVSRFGGTWYYYIWLPVLALFLCGVRPEVPSLSQMKAELTAPQQITQLSVPAPEAGPGGGANADTAATFAANPYAIAETATVPLPDIGALLLLIYLTGVAASLLITAAGYVRFLRRTLDREPVFVRGGMEVYLTSRVVSPVLTGFFKQKLILPDIDMAEDELELILRHEGVHRRRRDIWYKAAVALVRALHWFNPAAYWMERTIGEACEYACDEAVTKAMAPAEKLRYSQMILHVASCRTPALALGFSDSAKQLKRRFLHMNTPRKARRTILASLLAAVMMVSVFCLSTFVLAQDTTLTDKNGGLYTYYNISKSMEENIANTLGLPSPDNPSPSVSVISKPYIDQDAKKVTNLNRTEPVYQVQIGWKSKAADLWGAQVKTADVAGRTVSYAFLGEAAQYQDDPILNELVGKQIAFELTYQPDPRYGAYDHTAFISALIDQGVYVFEEVTPAEEFAPIMESTLYVNVPNEMGGVSGVEAGTIGLKKLTRYTNETKIDETWSGRVQVNQDIDGGQGVALGNGILVAAGQTLAIDIKELTDAMPTINVAIWDDTANTAVDWMPNLASGHRYYYTPGEIDAGHRYRVVVSTAETQGDIADIDVYTY